MLIYLIEDSSEILCHVDLHVQQHCCENIKSCELARLVDMIHTSFYFFRMLSFVLIHSDITRKLIDFSILLMMKYQWQELILAYLECVVILL